MIEYHKTCDGAIQSIPHLQENCWVAVHQPTADDIKFLERKLGVRPDYLRAALDDKETSHVKKDKTQTLIIIESPVAENEDNAETASFYTLPVSFIIFPNHVITISQHPSYVLQAIADNRIPDIETGDESNFVLHALYALAGRYIYYLRQIESLTLQSEQNLKTATKNKEILQLLNLQKSLVFFSTALSSTKSTLDLISRGRSIPLHEDDIDLLEDTQIEVNQAIEQATIYSSILSTMMDAFGSIISNNVNSIMKIMTAITIVMAIPNMVFGFYGMNVGLPLPFIGAPIVITLFLMAIVAFLLYRRDFFGE